ncbi:MAG: MarR family winged helix-turn-helix transcriptional regulator [Ardenticatenaceae bacterium]
MAFEVTSNQENLKQCVAELMGRMFYCLKPQLHDESPLFDLTFQQFRVLMLLYHSVPLRMSDISSRLEVGVSTVTALVSKLEDKGLVIRENDKQDRRVVFCSVTRRGAAEVDGFWRVRNRQISEIVDLMDSEQLELVAEALRHIVAAAEKAGESSRSWQVRAAEEARDP